VEQISTFIWQAREKINNRKTMNVNFCKDNEITNFREIRMGEIPGSLLYRGSSPILSMESQIYNTYNKLASDAKIKCVISLGDNESGLETIAESVSWYRELLKNNNIIGLDIHSLFDNEIFRSKLKLGFLFLMKHNGPYLIHCNAGTDRTGFVAAIIEGLLGAGLDEILYDYLLSYGKEFADDKNGSNIDTTKIILQQLNTIINGKINDKNNLQSNIEEYFLRKLGLSRKKLELLKEKLSTTLINR
jgi:hypothetical protein